MSKIFFNFLSISDKISLSTLQSFLINLFLEISFKWLSLMIDFCFKNFSSIITFVSNIFLFSQKLDIGATIILFHLLYFLFNKIIVGLILLNSFQIFIQKSTYQISHFLYLKSILISFSKWIFNFYQTNFLV